MDDFFTALGMQLEQRLKAARALDDMEPGAWYVEPQDEGEYLWVRDAAGDELAEVGHPADAKYIADWSPDVAVRLLEAELELLHKHREIPFGYCNSCHATEFPCSVIRNRAAAWGIKVPDYVDD